MEQEFDCVTYRSFCLEMTQVRSCKVVLSFVYIGLTLCESSPGFYVSAMQLFFKKSVAKGEIARNEQFLPLPQHFLPFQRIFHRFREILNCSLQAKFVVREGVKIHFFCQ